jgi:hypothetical protein
MTLEAQTIARACGKNHLHNLEPEDLVALADPPSRRRQLDGRGVPGLATGSLRLQPSWIAKVRASSIS